MNLHKDKAARKNFEIEAQSGFIHKTPGGGNELLFWRETFLKDFCAELSFDRVFSALKAEGLIIKQKGGKNGVTRTLAGENKSKRFIGIKAKILEC